MTQYGPFYLTWHLGYTYYLFLQANKDLLRRKSQSSKLWLKTDLKLSSSRLVSKLTCSFWTWHNADLHGTCLSAFAEALIFIFSHFGLQLAFSSALVYTRQAAKVITSTYAHFRQLEDIWNYSRGIIMQRTMHPFLLVTPPEHWRVSGDPC